VIFDAVEQASKATMRDDARRRGVAVGRARRSAAATSLDIATMATMAMMATTTTSMNAGRRRDARTSFGRATTTRATRATRATTTTTTAFLNFGGNRAAAGGAVDATPYVCVDCGYVYRGGDFKKLPNSYRCPTCNVGKNRFKAQGGSSMLAQKKANKAAFRARREAASKGGKATSGREALKQKMMDAQAEKDKKRGWF
jgi:rubredoxin